jgi:NAD(P)-dependent dehydrogenase (short-subunit alcohol dehydrogenase family)
MRLTSQLAYELGPRIRVNAVAPGVAKTKFAAALYEDREEEVSARYPLRRLGRPGDVGSLVEFLLSDDATWITGQTIVIDGGVTLASGEARSSPAQFGVSNCRPHTEFRPFSFPEKCE